MAVAAGLFLFSDRAFVMVPVFVSDRVRLLLLVAVSGPVYAITERFFETD